MIKIILIYFFLFLFAIPWYWNENTEYLLFGLPLWVTVSVFVSFLISCYTAYLLLTRPWPGEDQ